MSVTRYFTYILCLITTLIVCVTAFVNSQFFKAGELVYPQMPASLLSIFIPRMSMPSLILFYDYFRFKPWHRLVICYFLTSIRSLCGIWKVEKYSSEPTRLRSHNRYAVAPQERCNQSVLCTIGWYWIFVISSKPQLNRRCTITLGRLVRHQSGILLLLKSHIRGSEIRFIAN